METGLQIFEKEEFGKVRVVMKDGEPWFVANDVAAALGYAIPKDAVVAHCKYAELFKGGDLPPLTDSPRGINIIPESDVYALIFRSNLPQADIFRQWVCEEVLPSIRKTGGYGQSLLPQDYITALRALADAEEAKILARAAEQKAIAERDIAIRTKAEIGSRREATAMNTASIAVKERDKMADQLGEGKTWKQVKAIGWLGNYFNTRKAGFWSVIGKTLTKLSKLMDYPINSIPSSEYPNGLNRYHVDVIEQLRINLDMDENMLGKYRAK